MTTLRRRKWSNRLAWAVWLMRKKNKERQGGVIPPPTGNLFDNGILQANGVLQTDTILGLP